MRIAKPFIKWVGGKGQLLPTLELQKVKIICGDFEQTERYVSKNTFVYFDPPYRPLDATSSFNSYSKEAFNDK